MPCCTSSKMPAPRLSSYSAGARFPWTPFFSEMIAATPANRAAATALPPPRTALHVSTPPAPLSPTCKTLGRDWRYRGPWATRYPEAGGCKVRRNSRGHSRAEAATPERNRAHSLPPPPAYAGSAGFRGDHAASAGSMAVDPVSANCGGAHGRVPWRGRERVHSVPAADCSLAAGCLASRGAAVTAGGNDRHSFGRCLPVQRRIKRLARFAQPGLTGREAHRHRVRELLDRRPPPAKGPLHRWRW